ncbi:hypothetical protein NBE98_15280 [Clostridium swellfunianum]|uniref:DUF7489 domain-containing protein n=1 Tax=Clostridium swellfunianum TaxID=1367462 RepID=UPI00202EFCBE|nr:hypothetical protein [Clostridium swellfunianum]MCM0649727.1 hypothetical protein [Clostridium swellfunianum]
MELLWIFVLMTAIITLTFTIYSAQKYRLESTWSGLVQGKKAKDYYYKGQHKKCFILQILKDTGNRLTLEVDETTYKTVEVGDRMIKEKGHIHPRKTI